MKKKLISMFILLTILFSTYMTALAEEDDVPSVFASASTASLLKSKGAIVYQNGTDSVVIDSNDLYTLADAFDTYKAAIYWQMAEMNTYLTTEDEGIALTSSEDIHVVHSVHSDMDIIAPLSLNFDTLIEGVAASQSIPQTPVEYGYAEGTNLYKTAEGLLTTEPSAKTEMIEINGATADSLSAGTAAWIDGELILGKGSDNKAYYDMGYKDGFNKVMNGAHISYVYHKHQGNPNAVGGCYANVNERCNTPLTIGSHHHTEKVWNQENEKYFIFEFYNLKCPVCGYTTIDWIGGPELSAGSAYRAHNVTHIKAVCGKTTSTIESATITFN